MKTSLASLCLAAGVFVGFASLSSADTLTLGVLGDANIRSGSNANNNANSSQLLLTGATTAAGDYMRGLLSFDLSAPALQGATINSVSLNLFIGSTDATSAPLTETLQLFQLTSSFNETQVTWNNSATGASWSTAGGDFSSTVLSSVSGNPATATAGQQFTFASTADFVNSISNSLLQADKTVALLFKLDAEDNADRSLFRFYAGTTTNVTQAPLALRPQLVIDFTPAAVPEPSAFAAIAGLGALGFVASRRRR